MLLSLLLKCNLEQYTISPSIAATMLYMAAYANNDIIGKTVLDLGCGTGRLALGAAYLGAKSVVGIDIDRLAIKTAVENSMKVGLIRKHSMGSRRHQCCYWQI